MQASWNEVNYDLTINDVDVHLALDDVRLGMAGCGRPSLSEPMARHSMLP